ncbi:hypothetical protein [Pseudoxanthomonas sp. Root630]|uniref:hypothetical protein n=1 Tax=Pseudoxanthomonas sp. Root630 TaxID=1736574 RepID=UPI0007038F4F|nr:hypothetical protein [Pseudoxanthomonas sp. Root630]KRA42888.1 hypothetical protein ASD72_12500 [Pseudoxanthomonas sp. Root630]
MDVFWTSVRWGGIALGMLLALHGVIGLAATLWWPRLLTGRLFNERAIGRGPWTRERLLFFSAWSISWGAYLVLSLGELASRGLRMALIVVCTVLVYFVFIRKYT